MTMKSSYQSVSEQILNFNKNVVDLLSKLNKLMLSDESSISINITDESGILRQFNLPSFGYLKSEIDRLNNNLNSIYNIDGSGSFIKTSSVNSYKKVVAINLNKEPKNIDEIGIIENFIYKKNWFFDSLLNPSINIELDLSDKISDNIRKCLIRRYIIDFDIDTSGNLTQTGESALNSFNTLFRNKSDIEINSLVNWISTTPGVSNPNNPNYDEQIFDLEPNKLQYDGVFSVIRIEEDTIGKKLWYHLDTTSYINTITAEIKQLAIGDEVIINSEEESNTRYKILEVSLTSQNPRIRLQRIEGLEPVMVGTKTLKFYSPVIYQKKLHITIGYNERNVVFVKPINSELNLMSKDWSLGSGFWTMDLKLISGDSYNGTNMSDFYSNFIYDYGEVLQDLVAKKIPNKLSSTPPPPSLELENFKVVQINEHLTNSPDDNSIINLHNQRESIKSEVKQANNALSEKNKQRTVTRFTSEARRKEYDNDIEKLTRTIESKNSLVASINSEILSKMNPSTTKKALPKYRLRGFWSFPEAIMSKLTKPQNVIQFKIQYRYLSKSGNEPTVRTFKISDSETNSTKTAAFSNWNEYKTDSRKMEYNSVTNEYYWLNEDTSDADTPNINQLDLPIQSGEKIEFRIKSISEVGWPEAPVESDWSESLTIEFPDNLNDILDDNDFILQEANKEDLKVSMREELTAKGLDDHLSQTITINNMSYNHTSDKILSGFKDENGVSLNLYEYLQSMENKIKSLEEKIRRAKGELEIIIYRNSDKFIIKNNSEITFNVECEDYLDVYTETGIPTGRVYSNNIYLIKDFLLKIRNSSVDSPLGLLSNRSYNDIDIYNPGAPKIFWTDNENNLITQDYTGKTETQINNQFIWMLNYLGIDQTSANKLSDNIGNSFIINGNSITSILGSSDFNLGYSENSILSFNGNNNSLLDTSKWIDTTISASSTTKLLTTIHPVVSDLNSIIETNSEKIKTIGVGENNDINIPLNIYFKMNAMDTTKPSLNGRYINLNGSVKTIKHTKRLRFLLENEAENKPFIFTIKFIINRNRVTVRKNLKTNPGNVSDSLQSVSVK